MKTSFSNLPCHRAAALLLAALEIPSAAAVQTRGLRQDIPLGDERSASMPMSLEQDLMGIQGRGSHSASSKSGKSGTKSSKSSKSGSGDEPSWKHDLTTDFSWVEGDWTECSHSSLMSMMGVVDPESKHIEENFECMATHSFGSSMALGDGTMIFEFHAYNLNHCEFHNLTVFGPNPTCPFHGTDLGRENSVWTRNIFHAVGSYAEKDKIRFNADLTEILDKEGNWQSVMSRPPAENKDELVCRKHTDHFMVCDMLINEYRFNWMNIPLVDPTAFHYTDFGTHVLARDPADCECGAAYDGIGDAMFT